MQSVSVTIGRNVPTPRTFTQDLNDTTFTVIGPELQETLVLTDEHWHGFTELVKEALEMVPTLVGATESWIETHDGLGEWDGVQEQSRKLTLIHNGAPLQGQDLTQLEVCLVLAKSAYYQDAVALSFGESTLV